jgi:hypothetical protein
MWAIAATDKYYLKNRDQLYAHNELLDVVRRDIVRMNSVFTRFNSTDIALDNESIEELLDYKKTYMFNYTNAFAGKPVLYGICLQKQHLDAIHYPKRLEVRNSHRPYLYRFVL